MTAIKSPIGNIPFILDPQQFITLAIRHYFIVSGNE